LSFVQRFDINYKISSQKIDNSSITVDISISFDEIHVVIQINLDI